jgi:hypothetical protein
VGRGILRRRGPRATAHDPESVGRASRTANAAAPPNRLSSSSGSAPAVDGSRKHVALLVERGDARLFVPVDLG